MNKERLFLKVGWVDSIILRQGSSIYPAVNLRRNGLKCVRKEEYIECYKKNNLVNCYDHNDDTNNFDLYNFFEIIDGMKFMLARIKIGF
jgi:hypothetical protein